MPVRTRRTIHSVSCRIVCTAACSAGLDLQRCAIRPEPFRSKTGNRPGAEIHVICGFRTQWSNEYLRRNTSGVAQNSLHMLAEAIDIRLPGIKISDFRRRALELGRGGVG